MHSALQGKAGGQGVRSANRCALHPVQAIPLWVSEPRVHVTTGHALTQNQRKERDEGEDQDNDPAGSGTLLFDRAYLRQDSV